MTGRETRKKGFTLIEVIVVLTMLVILAGIGYSSVKSLVSRAEQNARDQVARSLFMAAQSALTHIYANDPTLADQYAALTPIETNRITPAISGGQTIVSLTSNGGSGAQAQMLLDLLSPYVDDKSVLEHNILLEFNSLTGNVLACFYSDETELAHGGDYDVYDRTESSLKDASVGYFGVSYTGVRAVRIPVDELTDKDAMDVILVDYDGSNDAQGNDVNGGKNYGLLTLELSLPDNAPFLSTDAERVVYSIDISSKNPASGAAQESFTLAIGNYAGAGFNADQQICLDDIPIGLDGPLTSYTDNGTTRQAAVFIDPQRDASGRRVLVLVLDSMEAGRGIHDLYPEIANGNLVAGVTASYYNASSTSAHTIDVALAPNSEHALFSHVDKRTDGGNTYYENGVSNVRHLNNIRHASDGRFVQTCDISMTDFGGAAYAMPPIDTFSGIYNGRDHKITGLKMPANTQKAGLFAKNSGSITHVYLYNAEIVGTSLAGGIAAENTGGRITNCTVYHAATAGSEHGGYFIQADVAGGIAAKNSGVIEGCYVGIGVQATKVAGGIAGESSGTVSKCEVATAMAARVGNTQGNLVGNPKYGAFSGTYAYGEQAGISSIDVNRRWIHASGNGVTESGYAYLYIEGVAGGVVGLQKGGTIENCVNAAHVQADGAAGGVVGSMYGSDRLDRSELTYSYNAGNVRAIKVSGGIAGVMHNADVTCCYNTAPVNCKLQDASSSYPHLTPNARYLPQAATQSTEVAGGIAGALHMYSRVAYCYNAGYVCAGAHTAHTGAFGRVANDSSAEILRCYFLRNCLNVSERYYYFTDTALGPSMNIPQSGDPALNCVTMLNEAAMQLLIRGDANTTHDHLIDIGDHLCVYTDINLTPIGAGPLFKRNGAMTSALRKYWFPVLRVSDWHNAGSDFHRTPYYPLLERFGELTLETDATNTNYILTAYVPAESVRLRLRLNTGTSGAPVYERYTADIPNNSAGGTLNFSGSGSLTGFTAAMTATTLTNNDLYYAYGCLTRYVITFPKTSIASGSDFHGEMWGPTHMTGPGLDGDSLWSETKVR